jgi:hypothetical protein
VRPEIASPSDHADVPPLGSPTLGGIRKHNTIPAVPSRGGIRITDRPIEEFTRFSPSRPTTSGPGAPGGGENGVRQVLRRGRGSSFDAVFAMSAYLIEVKGSAF